MLSHPGYPGNTVHFQVLGSISQGLLIGFDFCSVPKLRTSVKCFLDCKYGPYLVCFAPSRRITEKMKVIQREGRQLPGQEIQREEKNRTAGVMLHRQRCARNTVNGHVCVLGR